MHVPQQELQEEVEAQHRDKKRALAKLNKVGILLKGAILSSVLALAGGRGWCQIWPCHVCR